MLKIRVSQNQKLVDDQQNQFIHEIVDQLQHIISEPKSPLYIDIGGIKNFVVEGASNSNSHGVSLRTNVKRYHECMAEYGVDFNLDATLPWAFESALSNKLGDLPIDKNMIVGERLD